MKNCIQGVRFCRIRKHFDHGIIFAPRMSQEEEAALLELGDKESRNQVIEGHLWLAYDIASRFLGKLGVSERQAETLGLDLMAEGFMAIIVTVHKMDICPDNLSAYLSRAIENRQSEYLDRDNLCPVPPRTQRDRAEKDKPLEKSPEIIGMEMLDRRQGDCWRCDDLRNVEDLYDYCRDQLDRDILDLRFDGVEPRAIAEVAELTGLCRNTVAKRLNAIEARIYCDLGKPIPSGNRTKGKRFLQPCTEATSLSTSA